MSNLCQCTLGKENTQGNTCPDLSQIAARIIIVPKYNAAGAVNEIANVAGITKSALQAKFDANDIDDRWFPLTEFKNVVEAKADSIFQEFTDRTKVLIDEGKRNFEGHIISQGSILLGKLKSWACQEFGIYVIDKNSNFIYQTDTTTGLKVQPIPVDSESWTATLVKATDTTVAMIKISFDFSMIARDEQLRTRAYEDLNFDGLDTADVYALYTVNGVTSSLLATSITLTLTTDYGLPVKNLLAPDFYSAHGVGTGSELWRTSGTPAAFAITGFAETSDGVYKIDFVTQTGATVRITPDKAKYDFAEVVSLATTLP